MWQWLFCVSGSDNAEFSKRCLRQEWHWHSRKAVSACTLPAVSNEGVFGSGQLRPSTCWSKAATMAWSEGKSKVGKFIDSS